MTYQMTDPEDTNEMYRYLAEKYGHDCVWTTSDLEEQFRVQSFLAPFCFVVRKSDGTPGTVEFTHSPRFYFNFKAS